MEKDLDALKIKLENDLNRQTIVELLSIIRNFTDNVYNNMNHRELLEIMGNDIEILKNYYQQVIKSIDKVEE